MMQMRSFLLIVAIALAGCAQREAVDPIPDRSPPAGSHLYGVFEGKVPCEDCERVKVRLALFRNSDSAGANTYLLERIEVYEGHRVTSRGRWSSTRETVAGLDGLVYRLEGAPDDFGWYLAVGDDLLLMLDRELTPRVGNASHSFTLSRTQ
jgi:hypothetical protein